MNGYRQIFMVVVATAVCANCTKNQSNSYQEQLLQREHRTIQNLRALLPTLRQNISEVRSHVDQAAVRAGLSLDSETPARNDRIEPDEDFLHWIQNLPPEPPLVPTTYAYDGSRLRSSVLTSLFRLQLLYNELWSQFEAHQRLTNTSQLRTAISLLGHPPAVILSRVQDRWVADFTFVVPSPSNTTPAGQLTVEDLRTHTRTVRNTIQSQPLTPQELESVAILLNAQPNNLGTSLVLQGLTSPVRYYRERIVNLRRTVQDITQGIRAYEQELAQLQTDTH